MPGIVRGGSGNSPAARNDAGVGAASSTYVLDSSILADDTGRQVTDTVDTTGPGGTSPIPPNTFVGTVSDTGPQFADLADRLGRSTARSSSSTRTATPVTPTGAVTGVTLSAEGAPGLPGAGPDRRPAVRRRPTPPPAAATPAAC